MKNQDFPHIKLKINSLMDKMEIIMKIINMLDDYKIMCEESMTLGAFESYKRYTRKYHELFDGFFKVLYCTDINELRPMIEQIDFNNRLEIAIQNQNKGLCQAIIDTTNYVSDSLNFNEDFILYIGLELGNIGGCSGLPGCKTFLYIGIDRILSESFIKYTVPHEFNHMLRNLALKDINASSFCERVITEGLGSFAPLDLYHMEYTTENVALVLELSNKQTERLMNNTEYLLQDITEHIHMNVTQEVMSTYFAWQDEAEEYPLAGYYVGMYIIKLLMDRGHSFLELTVMPSELIWKSFYTGS